MLFKKTISILLLAAMLAGATTACAESNEPDTTQETPTTTAEVSDTDAPEETAEKTSDDLIKELFGDKSYSGKEFRILTPDSGGHFYDQLGSDVNEIYYEEYNGEIMNDAIVDRNRKTEELLDVKIVPVWGGRDTGAITTTIKNSVTSGSNDFDAVLNRMDFLGTSMQNGNLANLMSISTINPENPWWDSNIVNSFTLFNSKLFWISGDLNFCDDYACEVIFFNKRLATDNNLEYPYASVMDGTWTIDKFFDMAKAVERDLNGDGKLDINNDVIGHQENNDHVKHWIYALGEKTIDIDEDGSLEIMTTTERQINVVDKLYSVMVEGEMTYTGNLNVFVSGRALFHGDMLGSINGMRDMEDDFGIIPMPKFDETQANYGEYVSNGWTTAIAVPLTNNDREFTGVVLETLSAFSTDTVRKGLYDVLLSAKLIRDTETLTMLDIILDSKSYDWAVDFSWGSTFANAYNSVYNNKQNNYVSSAEKYIKAQRKLIEKLVTTVSELPD